MYCPLCGAEYRPGFTICSDCQVDLVPDLPRPTSANRSIDDNDEKSFALVWSGNDSRLHAEICDTLDHEKIPARTLGSEDHLFNFTTRPGFEVYVPVDLVNSAREAIRQAQLTPDEDTEQNSADLLEVPAEDTPSNDNADEYEERRDLRNLDPQDATVEIWSGEDVDMAAMMASSLRENDIPCRSDPDLAEPPDITGSDMGGPGTAENEASDETRATRLFVFPEDEKRAKEIVREIVNATPPE